MRILTILLLTLLTPLAYADGVDGSQFLPESSTSQNSQKTERACLTAAAEFFQVPEPVLHAIRIVEGGHTGEVNRNHNGTEDLGVMQINSSWLDTLQPYGITRRRLVHDDCLNIFVSGWVLARKLTRVGAYKKANPDPVRFWVGVGGYHSWTAHRNWKYARLVYRTMIDDNLVLADEEQK